jgi:ABC-type uncharacterized transport system substrate-binding protein
MIRPSVTILIVSAVCLRTGTTVAHPHVWVTMMSELIYGADGSVTGVRHNWTFDDMFSVFATQGLESKRRGVFTREELAPLAELNVTSLKQYAFFTFAKANGKKVQLSEPVDYYLDCDPKRTVLTLHFTLPFQTPVTAKQLNIDVHDLRYFVDFAFAEKNPMALVGAPPARKFSITRPEDATAQAQRLPETFFNSLDASGGRETQFANKVSVKCP